LDSKKKGGNMKTKCFILVIILLISAAPLFSSDFYNKIFPGASDIIPWHLGFEMGYVYQIGHPFGFRIGGLGFYTTMNIASRNWGGYFRPIIFPEYHYDSNNAIIKSGSGLGFNEHDFFKYDTISLEIIAEERRSNDWVIGFSFNIIDDYLALPIGIGRRRYLEYQLYEHKYTDTKSAEEQKVRQWVPSGKPKIDLQDADLKNNWKREFILEGGLIFTPVDWLYLLATYRLIGFIQHSFTVGTGFTIN